MLTISKPLSATQAQTYHAKEFTAAEQNYWKQGDAIRGEWHGKMVERLGLSGVVGAAEFARLSEGQNPLTGEQLVRHREVRQYKAEDGPTVAPVEHRAGWDATFSAPKSVSLTALVGGDERVREAHREAVKLALDELERYTQARIGGNRPAETTGRFIAATFEHDTARPVGGYAAPQLHTHAVIFNLTQRDDGQTRGLQERGFFATQSYATAVYQSQLTYRLRNLGYEIEAGKSGAPEIKGYTQEYLDASSPRRQQIEDALARSGFSGPAAAQIAAHNTRDRKVIVSPERVLAAHQQIATEFGNQANGVVAEALRSGHMQAHVREADERRQQAHSALTFARDRSFEREAVTDERALFVNALRRGMGETTYPEVRANFEARIASGEFHLVAGEKHGTGRLFTTAGTIKAELEVLKTMQEGQNRTPQIMSIQQAIPLTEARPGLNQAQRGAIEQVLTSRDRIQGLHGAAGAGKTTTLAIIRQAVEQNGYLVEGFAPTGRAARQLRDAGIAADTLQGFLARSRHTEPGVKHLYMIDESSLASTQQIREFLHRIGAEDKVLLIGDTRQHQGVDAGKPFQQLRQAGMQTAQLDTIVRQRDPGLLKAVEHLSKNETESAIRLLQVQGRVREIIAQQERITAIAKDYADDPKGTIIVSPDNASRRAINQAVREELQARGALEMAERPVRVLTPRSDMTGADRAWADRYQPGDILHYTRGSKEIGIKAGSYARVIATNSSDNVLTVQTVDGRRVQYDPSRLRGISAYTETQRLFAAGDRIQWTAPNRELGIANRDLGTIQKIAEDGRIAMLMDGSKEGLITFEPSEMRHFDHGYAVTSYSSQGLTAKRVLVNIDTKMHPDLIDRRLAYVSISRGSHDARIYTDDMPNLATHLSREVSKSSAIGFTQDRRLSQHPTLQQPTTPIRDRSAGLGISL
jgi:conjugative relaxase-like TrwC/TraI family protein